MDIPGQTVRRRRWLLDGLAWTARLLVFAILFYILFPPFWDALFANDRKSWHEAPYKAAERGRKLLRSIADLIREERKVLRE